MLLEQLMKDIGERNPRHERSAERSKILQSLIVMLKCSYKAIVKAIDTELQLMDKDQMYFVQMKKLQDTVVGLNENMCNKPGRKLVAICNASLLPLLGKPVLDSHIW